MLCSWGSEALQPCRGRLRVQNWGSVAPLPQHSLRGQRTCPGPRGLRGGPGCQRPFQPGLRTHAQASICSLSKQVLIQPAWGERHFSRWKSCKAAGSCEPRFQLGPQRHTRLPDLCGPSIHTPQGPGISPPASSSSRQDGGPHPLMAQGCAFFPRKPTSLEASSPAPQYFLFHSPPERRFLAGTLCACVCVCVCVCARAPASVCHTHTHKHTNNPLLL